jgi:hypothetical protein
MILEREGHRRQSGRGSRAGTVRSKAHWPVSVKETECCRAPELPVTIMLYVPGGKLAAADCSWACGTVVKRNRGTNRTVSHSNVG